MGMGEIVVAGGGFCGVAVAMLLAKDGHQVTVVDRDSAPPASPEAAWASWERRSVAHCRMVHVLLERGSAILRRELPEVVHELTDAGALVYNTLDHARCVGATGGGPEPGDERFTRVTARRVVLDWAMHRVAANCPGVKMRHDTAIAALVTGASLIESVPHVTGVRLASGDQLACDLLIDVSGRRGPTEDWLAGIGARSPLVVEEDYGFTYTGRHFRSRDGSMPFNAPLNTPIGSFSVLAVQADNDTWNLTIAHLSSDTLLRRRLRVAGVFESVIRACPMHVGYLDGEPISDLQSMSGTADRERTFVIDGVPVVTGMISVADAWACTNPSIGRGMTMGLMHAVVARDTIRDHLDQPARLALEFHRRTQEQLGPWHDATHQTDQARVMASRADIEARPVELSSTAATVKAIMENARRDLRCARLAQDIAGCLVLPADVLSRPGTIDYVEATQQRLGPPPAAGPDRTRLLQLLA